MIKNRDFSEVKHMTTEFFMPMNPPTVTHQEKQVTVRNGKPCFYEPSELKAARSKLIANLSKYRPAKPYTVGVQMVTKWCFPRAPWAGRVPRDKTRYRQPAKAAQRLHDSGGFLGRRRAGGFGSGREILGRSSRNLHTHRGIDVMKRDKLKIKALRERYPRVTIQAE